MPTLPFALQLYSVRDHLVRDFSGTLRKVKEIGYDFVELAGYHGLSVEHCRNALDDAGLQAVCSHVEFNDIINNTERVADDCDTLGIRYVCCPWIGGDGMDDRESWVSAGERLGRAATALRALDVQLCYHNHAHEFEKVDGEYILDILLESAGEDLEVELDVYWIQYAGLEPVQMIEHHTGHTPLLHVKDMPPGDDRQFTEVGRGVLDWPAIFDAAGKAGVEWFIVEQDESTGDSLESAAASADFMAGHR